jgi:hypothetical protein
VKLRGGAPVLHVVTAAGATIRQELPADAVRACRMVADLAAAYAPEAAARSTWRCEPPEDVASGVASRGTLAAPTPEEGS